MLLLVFASLGVLVTEDEVNLLQSARLYVNCTFRTYLVCGTTLIWAKHNDVWGCVRELLRLELLVVLKKLEVSSTTLKAIYVLSAWLSVCHNGMTDPEV